MNEIAGHVLGDDHANTARVGEEAATGMTTEPTAPLAEPIAGHFDRDNRVNDASSGGVTASAPIGSGDASGDDGAKSPVPTTREVPHIANVVGHGCVVDPATNAHTRPEHIASVAAIVELQKQRVFCIKSQSRGDRATEAFIARYLGYRSDMPPTERAAIWKRTAAIRKAVEKGGQPRRASHGASAPEASGDGHAVVENQILRAVAACAPIIMNSAASRLAWDNHRAQVEKQMRKLARTLPGYSWATTVKGFGDLGFAIVIGETGDLGSYATKERVWKRLGLAVIEGERQQRKSGADAAAAHGYSPRRRAEIWTIADSLFKHQWHGAKEDIEAGPSGPYGEIYQRRKTHTATREGWTLGRRDNDARRIMTKALIEDFWKAWRSHGMTTA